MGPRSRRRTPGRRRGARRRPSGGRRRAPAPRATRHPLRPVLLADEHERRESLELGVVQRRHGLEDPLHGPGGAGQRDDAVAAAGEQPVLAQGVGEELADGVAEDVRGLVAVEPRRDTEAARRRRPGVRPSRLPGAEGHPRPRVDIRLERRHLRQQLQRAAEPHLVGGVGAEVRGLHGARPASGDDEHAGVREPVAQCRGEREPFAAATPVVAAHDPDHSAVVDDLVEAVTHRRVVHGAQHRDVRVVRQFRVAAPRVRPGVRGRRVPVVGEALVQLVGCIEVAAVRIDRYVRSRWKDDRPGPRQAPHELGPNPPAEHDQAFDVGTAVEDVVVSAQVKALQAKVGQRRATVESGAQGGHRVDVHRSMMHRPRARGPPGRSAIVVLS